MMMQKTEESVHCCLHIMVCILKTRKMKVVKLITLIRLISVIIMKLLRPLLNTTKVHKVNMKSNEPH